MKPLPLMDACDISDEDMSSWPATPAHVAAAIDTAELRLQAWSTVCVLGAANLARVEDVLYTWDAHPRRLKNGALEGRVYAQRRGEPPHDIGGYKIGADGSVLKVPAQLAGVLPGCENTSSNEPDQGEPA